MKLTPKDQETLNTLKLGTILRHHKTLSDTVCYRLLDDKLNPVRNIQSKDIKRLVEGGLLKIEGERFTVVLPEKTYRS